MPGQLFHEKMVKFPDMDKGSLIYIWKRYIYVQFSSLNPLYVTSAFLRDILDLVYGGYVIKLSDIYPVL